MEGKIEFSDAKKLECWACDNCKIYSPSKKLCVCRSMNEECFDKLCELLYERGV